MKNMSKEKKEPPTPEMIEYSRLAEVEATAKTARELLRPVVIEQFLQSGKKYEGISYSSSKSYPIDELSFYAWVAETWPHLVRDLTQDLIDPIKFELAQAKELLTFDEIPESVYKLKETERITSSRRKP
jgi:hypothetical protein